VARIPPAYARRVPAALAEVDVPAYVVDSAGRIRWLNDAGLRLIGPVVGRPFTDVLALDPAVADRIFSSNLRTPGGHERTIDVVSAGRRRRVQLSSARLTDDEHVIGMFGLAVPASRRKRRPDDSPLTPRQHEVLALLADGASTEQIAAALTITETTVRNHVRAILRRLGVTNRLAAVAVARNEGLV
jgi:DNA-binding NarL/FixJ family response regulator